MTPISSVRTSRRNPLRRNPIMDTIKPETTGETGRQRRAGGADSPPVTSKGLRWTVTISEGPIR